MSISTGLAYATEAIQAFVEVNIVWIGWMLVAGKLCEEGNRVTGAQSLARRRGDSALFFDRLIDSYRASGPL